MFSENEKIKLPEKKNDEESVSEETAEDCEVNECTHLVTESTVHCCNLQPADGDGCGCGSVVGSLKQRLVAPLPVDGGLVAQ